MLRIRLQADTIRQLEGLSKPIELCDEQGRTLGFFSPAEAQPRNFDWGLSDEEIHRREQVRQGRPVEDFLAEWERRR